MNSVFVLSSTLKPLMPCRPARARQLLTAEKAAVYLNTSVVTKPFFGQFTLQPVSQ